MDNLTEEKENVLIQLKNNKLLICLLIVVLVLGIYLRFDDYGAEGYDSDDMNTIPAAVFAYYPHNYFPGLVSTEPPLGNYLIGLGCIASGEDFSGVSKVKPLFFPDRSAYIGKAMKNAERYCFMPNHIFGLIFLVGVIIFAFSFFSNIYSAAYFITFFSFFPITIQLTRRISVDIFLYTFVIFALLFLWKCYDSQKGSSKERLYLIFAFAFLGLAGATKFPAGALIIFSFLLLLEKYRQEFFYILQKCLKQIDLHFLENKIAKENINPNNLLINLILAIFSSSFFLMLFFNFSIKNLYDTYYYMTSLNAPGLANFNFSVHNFLNWLKEFLVRLTIIDVFIYFLSIFLFIKIIFKKNKIKQEKFVIYLAFLGFFVLTSFQIVSDICRGIPFIFGFLILMSWIFLDKQYSILNVFKIKKKYFLILLLIYSIFSFLAVYPSPYHFIFTNKIVCSITKFDLCYPQISAYSIKDTSLYLESVLNENETFLTTGIYNYYTRHNDDILWWIFYSNFKKQTGKEPGLGDYLKYYEPGGRRVRYIHTGPFISEDPADYVGVWGDIQNLKKGYKPNHVIMLYGREAAYVYDLDNLIKK